MFYILFLLKQLWMIILSSHNKDNIHNSPQESLSFRRESPENTLLSSKTSNTHSENEAVCVSGGASGITEVRLVATEKMDRTLMCHSPPATVVSSSSCTHEEPMIKNSSKLPPKSTACSGSKGASEDYWNREMASILHMLRESRQKENSPLLERLALLMEASMLSRTEFMRMSSELSDTEKSALKVALVTAFCSNWQSCKEQQQYSDTDKAQREHTHTEERLEHNTHMHRELMQNPSRGLRQNSEFC